MMIFLISLARATQRREVSISLLQKLGLPFEVVEAYDGWHESDLARHDECWPIRDTEVAAFYSHAKAMSRVVECDLSHGLILEDDFAFRPGFDPLEFVANLPKDCDFGSVHDLHVEGFDVEIAERGSAFHRVRRYGLMAVAYVASARFVQRFLDHCIPCRMPIDHQFRHLSEGHDDLRFYQAATPTFTGRDVPSTI